MIGRGPVPRQPIAVVVLGCRVGSAAAAHRVRAGAEALHVLRGELVVASGGRAWGGVVEADAMARALEAEGVRPGAIVREGCSLSTRENAAYSARALARRGAYRAVVVTCAWHLPRALRAFRAAGVTADGWPAHGPAPGIGRRAYHGAREAVARWLDR